MVAFPSVPEAAVAAHQRWGTAFSGYVSGLGGWHPVSPSTNVQVATLTAYGLEAGVLGGFAEVSARTVTYSAGDGTYWLIGRHLVTLTPSGWTGVVGTHYAWQKTLALPPVPEGCVLLAEVTVSGGAITRVQDQALRRFTGQAVVAASREVGALAVWSVPPGGRLVLPSGVTVAMRGHIDAGAYPLFDLSGGGTVSYPDGGLVRGEWYGARGDDTTDSSPGLHAALTAGPGKMQVTLEAGAFRLGSALLPPNGDTGWSLQGAGQRATILRPLGSFLGPLLELGQQTPTTANNNYWDIRNLTLDGMTRAAGSVGMRLWRGSEGHLSNLYFTGWDRGLHSSLSVVVQYENVDWRDNNTGWYQDNVGVGVGATVQQFLGCHFRNNLVCGVDLDGTHEGGLIRDILFQSTTFQGHTNTSGTDIGVRIRNAEQVHFRQCWFEALSRHVTLTGTGELDYPMRYITWDGCNFGSVNAASVDGKAVVFTGTGDSDGLGCWMRSTLISRGIFEFNQTLQLHLVDMDALGTASLLGTQWSRDLGGRAFVHRLSMDPGLGSWAMERVDKVGTTLRTTNDTRLVMRQTLNASPVVLVFFDDESAMPTDGTIYLDGIVTARQTDNAEQAAWHIAGQFRNIAGVASQQGAPGVLHAPMKSSGATDWDAHFDFVGGDVRLVITGATSAAVDWAVWLRMLRYAPVTPAMVLS